MSTEKERRIPPVHPGKILLEEFIEPAGLSQNKLAVSIHVSAPRINDIVRGKRSITADTALRLGRFFDVSPEFWMNLQARYDLETAEDEVGSKLDKEVRTLEEVV